MKKNELGTAVGGKDSRSWDEEHARLQDEVEKQQKQVDEAQKKVAAERRKLREIQEAAELALVRRDAALWRESQAASEAHA